MPAPLATSATVRPFSSTNDTAFFLCSSVNARRVDPMISGVLSEFLRFSECPLFRYHSNPPLGEGPPPGDAAAHGGGAGEGPAPEGEPVVVRRGRRRAVLVQPPLDTRTSTGTIRAARLGAHDCTRPREARSTLPGASSQARTRVATVLEPVFSWFPRPTGRPDMEDGDRPGNPEFASREDGRRSNRPRREGVTAMKTT
jgi:hypothetical protein